MDISVVGFTPKQRIIADLIWGMDDRDRVTSFVRTLPANDRVDAEIVISMLTAGFLDSVDHVDQTVVDLLDNIAKR